LYTLEKAVMEYLRLSRAAFCKYNPNVPIIFSSAAVALASRMWVDGSDYWPGTFYIALVGEPGTMKTRFIETYLSLFSGVIPGIPAGSPEAMVQALGSNRHTYIWFDEVGRLSRNIDSYMATLFPILNIAYYLGEIGQIRTKKEKSVVIPAGEYFLHAYFAGTPKDWGIIERRASDGFVRRTLVLPVTGEVPYYKRDHKNPLIREHIARLRMYIRHILKLLTKLDVDVVLPEYPHLEPILTKLVLDREKRILIHEYSQKIFAARILGNLITFSIDEDLNQVDVNEIIHRMIGNGEKIGVKVDVVENNPEFVRLQVIVPETIGGSKGVTLEDYLPPHYEVVTLKMLIRATSPPISAPTPELAENLERIRNWLNSGGSVVVSKTKFVQEIFNSNNVNAYKATIEALADAGYIKLVDYIYRGRTVQYVVLDPKARICANCSKYRTSECPRIAHLFKEYRTDFDTLTKMVMKETPPWGEPCEEFELFEPEEPKGAEGND